MQLCLFLNYWLVEFPLSVFANRIELRCEPKQLMLLYYKICGGGGGGGSGGGGSGGGGSGGGGSGGGGSGGGGSGGGGSGGGRPAAAIGAGRARAPNNFQKLHFFHSSR